MLLPAFDNLGIPYIPSSTLRGVARAQALRELKSEIEIAKYFGSLKAEKANQAGKIIFLDAYPLPESKKGGLALDIVNNLWSWDGNSLKYKPNPNTFFSLQGVSFLIGLRPRDGVSFEILEQVKNWLICGLNQGIGSQVNAGYGVLVEPQKQVEHGFFSVEFTVQGQLIHSSQKFA